MPDHATEKALVDLTRRLIDIPSVSRNEAEMTEVVRSLLPSSLVTVHDNDTVLFATTPRRKGLPLVVLAGHTDTVPIEDNVPSRVEGSTIFGRGTSDMKAALAVMLHTATTVELPPADFDLGFLFFGREELPSSENPLLPAFEECAELKGADFAILMEPTANALEVGCQGNLNLRVTFDGVSAHTARPWVGRNAVHDAILHLHSLAAAESNDVEIDGLIFRESATITGFAGGGAVRNIVPNLATVDINIRYAPSRKPADVQSEWQNKLAGEFVSIEVIGNGPPAPVVRNHPFVDQLLAAGAGAPFPKLGWTNASDFGVNNIPAINFGPGDPVWAHTRDEQIEISAIVENYEVLRRFLS